ncbi:hypothetical protein [Jannaschia formosa]|uniref:hypothetical protein n=1 Tax=Jannaschia formosa TaxID=2259592 RepID=UPI000E1B82DE|nr:hypothetical protein [Jannaschia formosa]TFL18320.1 hypothetical protein DR046_09485 [Jannaschia formosa]
MCLSTAVFAMFLTVIGPDRIVSEPGRYVIHADARSAHWVEEAARDRWCTIAPHVDRMERIAVLRKG